MQNLRKKGFTLFEILFMMAIAAILLAIIAPGISLAHHKALRSACMSNLRQVGKAVLMYANTDSKNYIPYPSNEAYATYYQGYPGFTISAELMNLLRPYTQGDDIFFDPAAAYYQNGAYTKERALATTPPTIGYFYLNCKNWVPGPALKCNSSPTRFAKKPCIMMCVGYSIQSGATSPHKTGLQRGAANYLYADGHVASRSTYAYPAGSGSSMPYLGLPWDVQ